MTFTIITRRVRFETARIRATRPAVLTFPLWGKSADAAHLLVVPKTIPLGNLFIGTTLGLADRTSFPVLPLGSKATMFTHLLVVFRTQTAIAGFPIAFLCKAFSHVGCLQAVVHESPLNKQQMD